MLKGKIAETHYANLISNNALEQWGNACYQDMRDRQNAELEALEFEVSGITPPSEYASQGKTVAQSEGLKWDADKLRMELVPVDSVRKIAEVYTYGASKYAAENWRKGIQWMRVYAAIIRHLSLWALGQSRDEESGLRHLAHAGFGILTLLNYEDTHPELDDRPYKPLGDPSGGR